MHKNEGSERAENMAFYRALESTRPESKRLFTDDYAIHFLGSHFRFLCRMARFHLFNRTISNYVQRRTAGSLSSVVSSTRLIDDFLKRIVQNGVRQILVLGAGFDTRALRLDYLVQIPVIEVDFASISNKKQQILRQNRIVLPKNLRFIQINFEQQDLLAVLTEQGMDLTIPSCILWEGVCDFLRLDTVTAVFSALSRFAKGSALIFTYIDRQVLEDPGSFYGAEKLLKFKERTGVDWTFGFVPEELSSYLKKFDFRLISDQGAREFREKYMGERMSMLKGYEFYRVAAAQSEAGQPGQWEVQSGLLA
jgi:methyltransferase (TIGR00027 family)